MLVRPFGHETASAAGKVAVEQVTCGDVHLRLVLAVAGVEVRRPVVLVVEVDGDPVEEAQARQGDLPLAEDGAGANRGGSLVVAGEHVLVDGHGDHGGGVTHALAHHL